MVKNEMSKRHRMIFKSVAMPCFICTKLVRIRFEPIRLDETTCYDQHDDGVVYYFSLLPISFPVDSKTNYVFDDTWSSFIHLWWICPWWRQCQYCLVRIFIIGDKGVWGVMGRVEPDISDIHCTAGQGQSQCLLGPIKWVTKTQQNTWVVIVVILIKPLQYFHSNEKKAVTS